MPHMYDIFATSSEFVFQMIMHSFGLLWKCSCEILKSYLWGQELRQALLSSKDEKAGSASYPMTPIGLIRSCFSTR